MFLYYNESKVFFFSLNVCLYVSNTHLSICIYDIRKHKPRYLLLHVHHRGMTSKTLGQRMVLHTLDILYYPNIFSKYIFIVSVFVFDDKYGQMYTLKEHRHIGNGGKITPVTLGVHTVQPTLETKPTWMPKLVLACRPVML